MPKGFGQWYAPEDKNVHCTTVDLVCAAGAKFFEPYGCCLRRSSHESTKLLFWLRRSFHLWKNFHAPRGLLGVNHSPSKIRKFFLIWGGGGLISDSRYTLKFTGRQFLTRSSKIIGFAQHLWSFSN